jgi:hypothetical protein
MGNLRPGNANPNVGFFQIQQRQNNLNDPHFLIVHVVLIDPSVENGGSNFWLTAVIKKFHESAV